MIVRALRLMVDLAWWTADTLNDVAAELADLATLIEGAP